MIKLDDQYCITSNRYGFELRKLIKRKDNDEGPEFYWGAVGYYIDLASAIKGYFNEMTKQAICTEAEQSLSEVVQMIKETYDKISVLDLIGDFVFENKKKG